MSALAPGALAPQGDAAPRWRRVLSQAGFDVRIQLRNGEQLLLTLVLPVLGLVALARTRVPYLGPGPRLDLAVAGVLGLAVVSAAFTGQAIAAGFDRRYGVLRLLGTTPLGRSGLVAGRVLAVLAIETLQVAVLAAVAGVLGWRPAAAGLVWAAISLLLSTGALVTLGLLLAGVLRAEAVLAAANLAWVLMAGVGGVIVPAARLGAAGTFVALTPSGALGEALRAALVHGRPAAGALAALVAWTAAGGLAAARWFRWD